MGDTNINHPLNSLGSGNILQLRVKTEHSSTRMDMLPGGHTGFMSEDQQPITSTPPQRSRTRMSARQTQMLVDRPTTSSGPNVKRKRKQRQPITSPPVQKTRVTSRQIQMLTDRPTADSELNVQRKKAARKTAAKKARNVAAALVGGVLPTRPLQLAANQVCLHCGASKIEFESLHFCCGDGSIKLAETEYPPELRRLFTSSDADAVHFRQFSRMYNNIFAFSSIGGEIKADTSKGIHVFKLQGQIYHYVPDLIPSTETPKYLQMYFYDGQHEAENRANVFDEVRQDIVDILMIVSQRNPYARFFRSLRELDVTENTRIILQTTTVPDQRTYNAPTSEDVAVIWTEASSSSESSSPHIIVCGKSDGSHRIRHYFGCYDPLQYPIVAPNGESGWHQRIRKVRLNTAVAAVALSTVIDPHEVESPDMLIAEEARRACESKECSEKYVSCREYYCYKLQNRPDNMLLRSGRCLQQYIVDMYVKIENTRLDFFRRNQQTIRADLYQGILDTVHGGECSAANVGRRVILPPSFLGGPRDMKRRYLNAMALVQRYGKPDLFITMTCNPNWPEIKRELEPSELAQNRPEMVTRVFRAKLLALKNQIMKKNVFGDVASLIYVVEFQKRGLPHAHFLIILKPTSKIKCVDDFDKYVTAEMPPAAIKYMRSIVAKHMMHGPCGVLNPKCPCMSRGKQKGKCAYNYPKTFSDYTTSSTNGYPQYRRRDTGDSATVRKIALDNKWVIPYNPYLWALFDCHINVEVCSTIQAVKYLYKYVYKGHDKIKFDVVQDNPGQIIDEIQQYQSGRWVSPCEVAWRIFEFDLFEMHPAVMVLQVHLPNMQTIQLKPSENLHDFVNSDKRSRTPLTEYFQVNKEAGGTGYLYGEFCEHYRWCLGNKKWFKRKNKVIAVGRLTFVAPAEGEQFYLRLLLQNVRSPISFEDLRTVNGRIHPTFQEAALGLQLLEEDDAVNLCLQEASEVKMPNALRHLFAMVLMFCQPSNPATLWERYYSDLSSDFHHQFPQEPKKVLQLTARVVEQHLEAMGKSLGFFGLQHLMEMDSYEIRRTRDIIDALDAPVPQECIVATKQLNQAQQIVFDAIISHVKQEKPGAFFIDGPGGTGKTFLYNALYAAVRLMNKIVLPTATSGIAASNIPSGRTAHSRFKIPLDPSTTLACDVPKQSSLAALLKETSLIIWDEASMARKENIESLDLLLRDLCNPKVIFGGKLIVFGGDFRQVLPVVPRKSMRETVSTSLVNSVIWNHLTKFSLTENIRARTDPEFSSFLLALGNGELQKSEADFVELPATIIKDCGPFMDPITTATQEIFPELEANTFSSEMFTTRAILTPMNEDVDLINTTLISKFPGDAVTYKSYDSLLDGDCNIYPSEFVNRLCPGGMSPHELILKLNCPVILLRNLLPSAGLCNGTRLLCRRFYRNLIECEITNGQHSGERVFIPRVNLRPPASKNYPFQFQRKQFPIKLSFAMTINKSQGQTLGHVAVYLPKPVFSPGQLYVALSRARKASRVSVVSSDLSKKPSANHVKNVVSFDVLKRAGIIEQD